MCSIIYHFITYTFANSLFRQILKPEHLTKYIYTKMLNSSMCAKGLNQSVVSAQVDSHEPLKQTTSIILI